MVSGGVAVNGPRLDDRTAGLALLLGYGLVLAVLYREPVSGFERAIQGVRSALYLVVLPALGVAVGGYASLDMPYAGGPVFVAASYLGVVGVAIALGGVTSTPLAVAGAGAFLLAALALLTSLWSLVSSLGAGLDVWNP